MTTSAADPRLDRLPDDPSSGGHVVSADLSQGDGPSLIPTLAGRYYTDPEVFAREQQLVFEQMWFCAVRSSDLAKPGAFRKVQVGRESVLVVRGRDGALRAFLNICRHRGAQLCTEPAGEVKRNLQCPYHAWTYGLDGKLRAAPRSEREPDFDRSALGLLPVAVDVWGPFIFVNPDVEAPPLAEFLGELPEIVNASGLDLDALRFYERFEYEIEANWKIVVENFLECYHCPVAHPSFSTVIDVDPDSYRLERHEWFSSQLGPLRASVLENGAKELPYDPTGSVQDSQFYFFWPNFTLNVIPGPPNMLPLVFLPLSPERTLGVADYYFAEGVSDAQARSIIDFGTEVDLEDKTLVESVHEGLRSGMVERGKLLLSSEHLIQHFQQLVSRALA